MANLNVSLSPKAAGVTTTVTQTFNPRLLSKQSLNKMKRFVAQGYVEGYGAAAETAAYLFKCAGVSSVRYMLSYGSSVSIRGFDGSNTEVRYSEELGAIATSNTILAAASGCKEPNNRVYASNGYLNLTSYNKAATKALLDKIAEDVLASPRYQRAAEEVLGILNGTEPVEL